MLERTRTSLCKQKWKQRDFLANGAALIDGEKRYCSMSALEKLLNYKILIMF